MIKFLVLGINKSEQAGTEGYENFKSDSPSDEKLCNALKNLGFEKEDWNGIDIINEQMKNEEFERLSDTNILELCEKNKDNLLNEIGKISHKFILLLGLDKTYRWREQFISGLKKQQKDLPKMVEIYHPSWASGRRNNKIMSDEDYSGHIKDKLEKAGLAGFLV